MPDTVQSYAARRATLKITCKHCGRQTLVDAHLLARGVDEDTQVENLRFRCRTCFKREFTVDEYRPG